MIPEETRTTLYWHCAACGAHEQAQPEYEHGDTEPCVDCCGTCRVVTIEEAAAIEHLHVLKELAYGR